MASDSENIRNFLNILEEKEAPKMLVESIIEEGWLSRFSDKIDRRLGKKELNQLTDRLNKEWKTWLEQTDRDGTLDDLIRFMEIRIGFTDDDIDTVMKRVAKKIDRDSPEDDESEEETTVYSTKLDPKDDKDSKEDQQSSEKENSEKSDSDSKNTASKKSDDQEISGNEKVVKDDYTDYLDPVTGNWDEDKIKKKLDTLPIGTVLDLDYIKRKRTVEEEVIFEDDGDEILSDTEVQIFMRSSAAHINDAYLLNGPRNDRKAADRERTERETPNRRSSRGRGGASYDAREMNMVLQDLGVSPNKKGSVGRKVSQSDSIDELDSSDRDILAKIGYAFFKSR